MYLEGTHESLIYTHHSSSVIKLPTVVWRRKYCYKLPLGKELIPILNNLQREPAFITDANKNCSV